MFGKQGSWETKGQDKKGFVRIDVRSPGNETWQEARARLLRVMGTDLLVLFGEKKRVHKAIYNPLRDNEGQPLITPPHLETPERLAQYEQAGGMTIPQPLRQLMADNGTFSLCIPGRFTTTDLLHLFHSNDPLFDNILPFTKGIAFLRGGTDPLVADISDEERTALNSSIFIFGVYYMDDDEQHFLFFHKDGWFGVFPSNQGDFPAAYQVLRQILAGEMAHRTLDEVLVPYLDLSLYHILSAEDVLDVLPDREGNERWYVMARTGAADDGGAQAGAEQDNPCQDEFIPLMHTHPGEVWAAALARYARFCHTDLQAFVPEDTGEPEMFNLGEAYDEGELFDVGWTPSEQELAEIEAQYGMQIPDDLRRLLTQYGAFRLLGVEEDGDDFFIIHDDTRPEAVTIAPFSETILRSAFKGAHMLFMAGVRPKETLESRYFFFAHSNITRHRREYLFFDAEGSYGILTVDRKDFSPTNRALKQMAAGKFTRKTLHEVIALQVDGAIYRLLEAIGVGGERWRNEAPQAPS